MRKATNIFLAYSPVILIAGQLLCNSLWFFDRVDYYRYGFYLNTFFGTNVAFGLFLVVLTHRLKFCRVSIACAYAQIAYAVNYLLFPRSEIYNLWFQIGVGVLALIVTFSSYIKKFPLCKMSLVAGLIGSVAKTGSCKKGLEHWDRNVKSIILKTHRHENNH